LMIAVFLMSMAMGGSALVLPLYASSLGASYTEIGMLGVAYVVLSVIFSIPAGRASDRRGRRNFIITGFFATAAVLSLYAVASSVTWLIIFRLLQGLTETVLWINVQGTIGDNSAIDGRGRAMGAYGRSWGLGVGLGPILGGLMYATLGAQISFLLWGLVAFASAAVAMKIPASETRPTLGKTDFSQLYPLCLAGLIYVGTIAIINTIVPVYATTTLGMSAFQAGLLITLFVLVRAVLFTPLGTISDRRGHRPVILAGMLGISLFFLLLCLASDAIVLSALLIPLAISAGAIYPSVMSAISKLGGGLGYLMGIFNLITSIGWGVFPGVGGALADSFGPSASFLMSGVLALLSTAILWKKLPRS
jgi:MFS family permease